MKQVSFIFVFIIRFFASETLLLYFIKQKRFEKTTLLIVL